MTTGSAGYDSIAEAYDRFVRNGTMIHELSVPAVLHLCEGRGSVLDVACGQGVLTRDLAGAGFKVTGTDISPALLAIARRDERTHPHSITYVQDDACSLRAFDDATFDGTTSNLAINDIDDLPGFMTSVARVLKPAGWFVFSGMHPCFYAPTTQSGSGARHVQYFQEGRWWRQEGPAGPVARLGHQHRTLATLLNTMHGCGLSLERLEEIGPDGSDQPTIVVVKARKSAV